MHKSGEAFNLIVCTRDLDYGVGSQIKNELNQFDADKSIGRVIVIGPKKLEGYSNKIVFEIVPTKGKFFITKEPYFSFKCNRKIMEIIRREKIDIIYLHFPIFARHYGIKTIRKVHLLHRSIILQYPKKNRYIIAYFFHYLYSYFDLRTVKYADRVFFVSRSIMNDAECLYPEYRHKFEYRPNRIDKNIFFKISEEKKKEFKKKQGWDDQKINILFVGRLEPLKGIEAITKIFEDINQNDIRLIVVGDGPLKVKITEYPFVQYIGKVEHSEMYFYYNISDLFVMPSYYETFGLTVFEALACGCRILSRNVGDIRFGVDQDFLFMDDREFKQKMIRFISNWRNG